MGRQPAGRDKKSSGSLRRGAWSGEEDVLLRQCVEKYGEGNWHRVPTRAGLNRCRKSCRLRWLKYLHPDIKRGEFEEDEVDLIRRLHKLLGNRWSLIAGRIPGRTANDIKNYGNTRVKEKMRLSSDNIVPNMVKAIRPLPRSFVSKSAPPKENDGQSYQQERGVASTEKVQYLELPIRWLDEAAPSSRAGEVGELINLSTDDQQITSPLVPASLVVKELTEKMEEHTGSACWMVAESLVNYFDDLMGDDEDVWRF